MLYNNTWQRNGQATPPGRRHGALLASVRWCPLLLLLPLGAEGPQAASRPHSGTNRC